MDGINVEGSCLQGSQLRDLAAKPLLFSHTQNRKGAYQSMKENATNIITHTVAPSTKRFSPFFLRRKRILILFCAWLILIWALLPAIRAVTLLLNTSGRSIPPASRAGIAVQEVQFRATDGVRLAGWLAIASAQAPTIILVHGFKGSRLDMLPYARFLYKGGFNVLLYDSRGSGASAGWGITLGAREPDDVIGAVHYLEGRADLTRKHFGLLGISLGAGIALMAAAREPGIAATVADSAWVDESAQIEHMGNISRAPFTLPLLPYEPALVDMLIGAHLADGRPVAVIAHIAPRAVFLIHSADDHNTTTPLAGEHQLYAAAGTPKQQWIAPSGGHVGAIKAHTVEYEQRVLAFFRQYLV
jgi:pimeloyl-ACP methyl ester carboxylesterase